VAEVLTAVNVRETVKTLAFYFFMVDKECDCFVSWHFGQSFVQPFAKGSS
jgi:hypothetical protein